MERKGAAATTSQKPKEMTDRSPLVQKDGCDDGFFNSFVRPCTAEFVATSLFVFIGTMAFNGNGILGIALAHGLGLAVLVMCLANISGGHINPAVTLGVFLSGSIGPLKAIGYVISQCLGGMVGAALTRAVLSKHVYKDMFGGAQDLGPDTSASEGILCEAILTCILVTAVLLAAVDTDTNSVLGPLGIGFALAIGVLAGAKVTGPSINPAASFGRAVAMSHYTSEVWDYHYVYWVGPAIGAVVAAILFRLILAGPQKRLFDY